MSSEACSYHNPLCSCTDAVSTRMTHTASGCGRDAVLTWLQGSSKSHITSCNITWSLYEPKLNFLSVFLWCVCVRVCVQTGRGLSRTSTVTSHLHLTHAQVSERCFTSERDAVITHYFNLRYSDPGV